MSAMPLKVVEIKQEKEVFLPSPVLSRLVAAFIDYVLLLALLFLSRNLSAASPLLRFLSIFLSSAGYYSLCHSFIGRGQTLGKKAFGLRVIREGTDGRTHLSPIEAFVRFLGIFGALILLAEIPPLLYRSTAFSGSVYLIEFHMLLAMMLVFSNLGLLFFDPLRRGLHDFILPTRVVMSPKTLEERSLAQSAIETKRLSPILGIACLAALCFWGFGLSALGELRGLQEVRYTLEKRFEVELVSFSRSGDKLRLTIFQADWAKVVEKEQIAGELAGDMGRFLLMRKAFSPEVFSHLEFEFLGQKPGERTVVTIDTRSMHSYGSEA